MAVYTLTREKIRDRVEHKIRTTKISTRVNEWINDVIQNITSEVFFVELLSGGDLGGSDKITGDGSAQTFDLPEDFAAHYGWYSKIINQPLEEITSRQHWEDHIIFDTPVQTPRAYIPLGRTGAAGSNGVPLFQVRFESIPPSGEDIFYQYYRLHPELDSDTIPVLLPQNMLNVIVDGVLIEADSWNDSDQFGMHANRYEDKIKQLKKNQNRSPNLRRTMGRSSGLRGRPGRVQFPSNYPHGW